MRMTTTTTSSANFSHLSPLCLCASLPYSFFDAPKSPKMPHLQHAHSPARQHSPDALLQKATTCYSFSIRIFVRACARGYFSARSISSRLGHRDSTPSFGTSTCAVHASALSTSLRKSSFFQLS